MEVKISGADVLKVKKFIIKGTRFLRESEIESGGMNYVDA